MSDSNCSRRDFLKMAGLGAAAIMLPSVDVLAVEKRKPNVIVIISDDHGYAEMGCQGCKDIPTPNLDSIAKNGIRFTDGYVSCPVCSPTRAGIMTGRYQQRFGHDHNFFQNSKTTAPFGLPLDQKTIADYMKAEGYITGAIGKWHLGDEPQFHPNKRGFDEFFGFSGGAHPYLNPLLGDPNTIQRNGKPVDEREYLTYAFGREAVSFIDRHKAKPFFLYLSFNAVHGPLEAPVRLAEAFPEIKDEKRRTYAKMQKAMDDAVGSVLSKVRETGLEEDTLIIFLGDNGGPTESTTSRNDPFKGYKSQVHEGGIRVPFMAQWKGAIPAGKTYSKPVIALDILPTAVTIAGGKAAANVDGTNLMPYLTGIRSGVPHDSLYWRYDKQSAIRKGDWKLARHQNFGVRLFNLADDPGEKNDLSAKHPDMVKELQGEWEKWNAKNKEPMWDNRWHPPFEDKYW